MTDKKQKTSLPTGWGETPMSSTSPQASKKRRTSTPNPSLLDNRLTAPLSQNEVTLRYGDKRFSSLNDTLKVVTYIEGYRLKNNLNSKKLAKHLGLEANTLIKRNINFSASDAEMSYFAIVLSPVCTGGG